MLTVAVTSFFSDPQHTHMPGRRASPLALHRTLRDVLTARKTYSRALHSGAEEKGTTTLYSVLGVQRTASTEEIKRVFRLRAKALHPDVAGHSSAGAGDYGKAVSFAELLVAYQILSDLRERQLYDLSLNEKASGFTRRAAEESSTRDWREAPEQDAGWWERETRWRAWAAGLHRSTGVRVEDLDRLRPELTQQFSSALQHAFLGPKLRLCEGEWPLAFEAEERSSTETPDLLQIISGRTLLGAVRLREDVPLDSMQQHLPGEAERGPASLGDKAGGSRRAAPRHEVLDLLWQDRRVATALVQLGGDKSRQTTVRDAEGQVMCTEEDGSISLPGSPPGVAHWLLRARTPLVRHLNFVAERAGKDGKRIGLCVARRAWLPHCSIWLFPPRSPHHTTGGWYLEWDGYEQEDHVMWLDPAVFILLTGAEALRAERGEGVGRYKASLRERWREGWREGLQTLGPLQGWFSRKRG